jgi:tRNA (adenine57-N1/adenine58-N1)-methyltransferase
MILRCFEVKFINHLRFANGIRGGTQTAKGYACRAYMSGFKSQPPLFMAKILIRKAKKEFVKELDRYVTISDFHQHYIADTSRDFHTKEGIITKSELKKKDGSKVLTNTKKEFIIFSPSFIDNYKKIERFAQMIPLKDIGIIISTVGINKKTKVLDAGTGSGGLALFLANVAKEVISYDINKENLSLAKRNTEFLGIKNVKLKEGDIYRGIKDEGFDVFILDVPTPWNAIKTAEDALNVGGFLVSYSPNITQVQNFVNTINQNVHFAVLKTVEIIEREWKVEGQVVRPRSLDILHSGFLTFVRRI